MYSHLWDGRDEEGDVVSPASYLLPFAFISSLQPLIPMAKILIIEDDPDMAYGLRDNLRFEGYDPLIALDGEEGLDLALGARPDLILLDIMLPGMDGFEVCRRLRDHGSAVPIIMLTAKDQESDKVQGLDIGADDYITKPFGLEELLARIRAALRRAGERREIPQYRFGDVMIDFLRRTATKSGVKVSLSPKEYDVMQYLISNEGKAVSREELLSEIWGYEVLPDTRTVDTHMASLRAKLEEDHSNPKHILTVHGMGYRFVSH